ncbi:hypothetical protein OL67_003726 (plasmid) [Phaeobacter piscinae]|nr:hypothetical protein OL67_003726 [Phaeobacter piscinae]
MELAHARSVDAVLVTELSRWGRSTQDLLDTLNKLSGWNVSVVAISSNQSNRYFGDDCCTAKFAPL